MRYTQPPDWFLEPRSGRILHLAQREGLHDLTLDEQNLISDFVCKDVGAKVQVFDGRRYAADAADYANDKLEAYRKYWGSPTANIGLELMSQYAEEFVNFHRSVHRLLVNLDLANVPGSSSLQRAVRLIKWLRHMSSSNRHNVHARYPDPASALNSALEQSKQVGKEKIEQLEQLLDHGDAEGEVLVLIVDLLLQEVDITEMLRMARHLDGLSELQRPMTAPRADIDGEDTSTRSIEELGELIKAGQQALGLPRRLLLYRAINGDLQVSEPVTRRDKRQLLYILMDGSGSMQKHGASGRAAGVVLDRLQAVVRGEAEVYLCFFDGDLRETEYHANSPESALALLEVVTNPMSYTGRTTHFVEPLSKTARRVSELVANGDLIDEEIFIVTDGAAPVPEQDVLQGAKLHSIQVGKVEVEALSDLARASGGINLHTGPVEVEVQ